MCAGEVLTDHPEGLPATRRPAIAHHAGKAHSIPHGHAYSGVENKVALWPWREQNPSSTDSIPRMPSLTQAQTWYARSLKPRHWHSGEPMTSVREAWATVAYRRQANSLGSSIKHVLTSGCGLAMRAATKSALQVLTPIWFGVPVATRHTARGSQRAQRALALPTSTTYKPHGVRLAGKHALASGQIAATCNGQMHIHLWLRRAIQQGLSQGIDAVAQHESRLAGTLGYPWGPRTDGGW